MTVNEKLKEFRDLLLTADPEASHYKSTQQENYTVWDEYGENKLTADDAKAEMAIKIQIDRFTKIEYDPVVDAIRDMLDRECIAYEYLSDNEPDSKYIHHIFDCEVD